MKFNMKRIAAMCLVVQMLLSTYVSAQTIFHVTGEEAEPLKHNDGWRTVNFDEKKGTTLLFPDDPENPGTDDKCVNIHIEETEGVKEYQPYLQRYLWAKQKNVELSFDITITNNNTVTDANKPFENIKMNYLANISNDYGFNFFVVDEKGDISAADAGVMKKIGAKLSNAERANIKVEFDNEHLCYNIYINGELKTPVPFKYNGEVADELYYVRFISGSTVGGYDYYLDDIKCETFSPLFLESNTILDDVKVNETVGIRFNNNIDETMLTGDSIKVMLGSELIPCSYVVEDNMINILFDDYLKYESNYTIVLSNIYDENHRVLDSAVISMTTEAKPQLSVQIDGNPVLYQTLEAKYTGLEQPESIQWLTADSADGEFQPCGDKAQLIIGEEFLSAYIKARLTFSEEVIETAVIGPVRSNTNLAYNAKVIVPSQYDTFPAEYMVDNDTSTRWASRVAENSEIVLDFGSKTTFNNIEFNELGSRVANFRFMVSDDGESWSELLEKDRVFTADQSRTIETFNFGSTSARYLKLVYQLHPNDNGGLWGISVWEWSVYNLTENSLILANVNVTGNQSVGETLTAGFDSFAASDAEYSYVWKRADKRAGPYEEIEGAVNNRYMLSREDENKFIMLTVCGQLVGSEHKTIVSSPIIGKIGKANSMPPYVHGIEVQGNPYTGDELTFTYKFDDVNDDEESGTVYNILVADSESMENPKIAASGEAKADTPVKYVITEEDVDRYIAISIIPGAENEPQKGEKVTGKALFVRDYPTARDAVAELSNDGKYVVAGYEYVHRNGDGEKGSVYKWYISSKKDGNYTVIDGENDKTYKITSSDYGKYIKFSVTPKTANAPTEGKTEESAPVFVERPKTTSSGGGGSSSFIGGGSSAAIKVEHTAVTEPAAENDECKFEDIENHWAKEDILWLSKLGAIKGVTETAFEPDRAITRAELVSMLVRTFDIKAEGEEVFFDDVAEDAWYYDAVMTAARSKIISGDGTGFRPDSGITREELARIAVEVYRLENIPLTDAAPDPGFEDSGEIAAWAFPYVINAVKYELMSGMTEKLFDPKGNVTRAQAAVVIRRLLENM